MITRPKAARYRIPAASSLERGAAQALRAPQAAELGLQAPPSQSQLRKPELTLAGAAQAVPQPAAPQTAASAPAPVKTAKAPADASLFEPAEDGFGDQPFPTAAAAHKAAPAAKAPPATVLAAIEAEGLSGRQLRLARRMAEKHDITFASDIEAVYHLRQAGLDPFGHPSVLDIVNAAGHEAEAAPLETSRALTTQEQKVPATASPNKLPPGGDLGFGDVQRIQRDIAKRRRRKAMLLWVRLMIFVGLPTLLAGIYYSTIATPMYATRSEFVIQQANNAAAGAGLGGLFSGTQFATSQDSIAVQGYLQSREAMLRLDSEIGFRKVFADPSVDALQRLDDANSIEDAYKIYKKYVKIAYDPTEGIIKLEVSGPDAELSAAWSRQLIGYAEEQVNHLSERLRADQMRGATDSYREAEEQLRTANEKVVQLQERNRVLSSEVEVALLTSQITGLESQLTQERLALAQMLSNANPNRARVEPVQRRITTLEEQVALLRARLTEDSVDGRSLARIQSELLVAEADVATRQLLMTQAAQQLETARIEANRQQRYLSLSVAPVAPDVAAYPRAFENTSVAFLIFAGIYLLIALTGSVLREQIST